MSNGTGDLQQQQQQRQQEEQHHEFHIDESILNNEQHNHLLHHHHHHHQHHHTDISSMMKIRQSGSGEEPFNPVPENNGGWSNFNFNAPMTNSSAIPFINHRNQSCLELNTGQTLPYSQHPAWPLSANSETFSPTHGIEHIPDFNNPFAINQIGENGGDSGGGGGGDYPINPVLVSPGPLQPSTFPTSPPFSTSSSDGHDLRHDSIQGRTHSPSFSTAAHILRRDGIRKKNARFDIPAERNLKTIDQLINSTNDESELKELKQQKRLLRNRQAA